jgi:type I restriction enzyme M protein
MGLADRRGEILFIDARSLGVLVHRGVRVLTHDDLTKITETYHAWRGTEDSPGPDLPYEDVAGFCRSAYLQEIREQDHILTPGRYVGYSDGAEPSEDKQINKRISRLTWEFISLLDGANRLEIAIRDHMREADN